MRQPEFSPAARVQAATLLLNWGWGRPPPAPAGDDGKIIVTIRQVQIDAAAVRRPAEPRLLTHGPSDTRSRQRPQKRSLQRSEIKRARRKHPENLDAYDLSRVGVVRN